MRILTIMLFYGGIFFGTALVSFSMALSFEDYEYGKALSALVIFGGSLSSPSLLIATLMGFKSRSAIYLAIILATSYFIWGGLYGYYRHDDKYHFHLSNAYKAIRFCLILEFGLVGIVVIALAVLNPS